MTGLLISQPTWDRLGDRIVEAARAGGGAVEPVLVPTAPDARLDQAERDRAEIAYFSGDLVPDWSRSFFSAIHGAPNIRWLHIFFAGVDNPVFGRLLERGLRLTTSSGSTARPIAQTTITGMLMLSRGFPHWLDAQRRHSWEPIELSATLPEDLEGQTMVVVGLGAIGSEIARLARAFGLRVIGVRRSPRRSEDPVDEMISPAQLDTVLPRADWLTLATPLTAETRRMVGTSQLELLPRGARILNIARGEVIDEAAMIAALLSGRLAGAYLDVFEEEPLPPASPLWDLPNVIVTPHNSSIARGTQARVDEYFLANITAWFQGRPLANEVAL